MVIAKESWQAYFSPKGNCKAALVEGIEEAKKIIYMMIYQLTHPDVIKALVDAKKRGVEVHVILDRSMEAERYEACPVLKEAKIDFRIDRKHHIHHNKVCIIDGKTLFTGSFNFTNNAEQNNAENLLRLEDESLCAEYRKVWGEHYDHCVVYGTPKTRDDEEMLLRGFPGELD
jgi:phosphatidylserine/phosphatidylglycerophosphate/cardiolipin synthase-like enzyme